MNNLIKLSRSTVERFISCPRCCVLEKIYDIRPPSLPFTLNIAVDNLCKNEFDYFRDREEPHPLFIKNNIDAIPFKHRELDDWRNNYKGIRYKSVKYKYDFGGAIDDIWQKSNGELIIVDIKATSKNNFNWYDIWNKYDYPKSYKRQLEIYQWLFKMNGFKVADEAYIIYFNGKKNEKFFKNKLEFESHFVKLNCSTDWVEPKVIETVELLRSNTFPKASSNCENCNYLNKRWKLFNKLKN
tara:strand:- start:1187 stop:1909 length:723 start_codon:yes stop_codon:yes gene_type:complete